MSNLPLYSLSQIILNSTEKFPHKSAFKFNDRSFTYEDFAEKMFQLANALHSFGLKKGERVGILMPRSLESALAIYGILHAGGVFVPLDPQAPMKRLDYMIQNCGIKILITVPSQLKQIQSLLASDEPSPIEGLIGLSEVLGKKSLSWKEVFSQASSLKFNPTIVEQDPAYIIYTSGSTGLPKGIVHSHRSGLAYAQLSAQLYNLNQDDRLAHHAQMHYDMMTFGYFSLPLVGASTHIISEPYIKMPASLSKFLEKEKITVWYSVPLALSQLLQFGNLNKLNVESLRWVLFGGEPFTKKVLGDLMKQWPQATFSNVYGPVEVNQCTYYNFSSLPKWDVIPLGQVWDNTEILLLDDQEEIIEQDGMGELLVRSATMMQGYWKEPERNQKAFYEHISESGLKEVFYRTGDLVERDSEGLLWFKGRRDRQVKIRGYRVELGELEAKIEGFPYVKEVAVYTSLDEQDNRQVELLLVLQVGVEYSEEAFRQTLREELPPYAQPHKIILKDELPRSPSGKVDYKKLEKKP